MYPFHLYSISDIGSSHFLEHFIVKSLIDSFRLTKWNISFLNLLVWRWNFCAFCVCLCVPSTEIDGERLRTKNGKTSQYTHCHGPNSIDVLSFSTNCQMAISFVFLSLHLCPKFHLCVTVRMWVLRWKSTLLKRAYTWMNPIRLNLCLAFGERHQGGWWGV